MRLGYVIENAQVTTPNGNSKEFIVSAGYYLARFQVVLGTSAFIDYDSDGYTCPFGSSGYVDLRNIF